MSRYMFRFVRSRSVRALALSAVALLAGWLAAQHAARGAAERRSKQSVPAGDTSLSQPSTWLTRGGGWNVALEVDLDEVVAEANDYGGIVFDRQALITLVEEVMGVDAGVEEMRLRDLLDEVPRIRLIKDGYSIVLGRLTLRRLGSRALGEGVAFEDATLGDLLNVLSGVEVSASDIPARFDARSLSTVLRDAFRRTQPLDHSQDPTFEERRELELRYAEIVRIVKGVRREGFGADGDNGVVYDEAYTILLGAGRSDDIPLLDAHMRLEEELESPDLSAMSYAERIAFRWEARRWAFGEALAEVLFSRKEAMERYNIDRLALEADEYSAPEDKARWLRERRTALKVELAAQGTYVGFPDEAALDGAAAKPERDRLLRRQRRDTNEGAPERRRRQ